MNKAFEKILKKTKEKCKQSYITNHGKDYTEFDICTELSLCFNEVQRIVQEVAEEYHGGWIPCSERLPEDDSICIVTVECPNNEIVVDYGWFDRICVCWYVGMQEFRTSNVLAWQLLPEPYKEGE